jgi:hypothetical protein
MLKTACSVSEGAMEPLYVPVLSRSVAVNKAPQGVLSPSTPPDVAVQALSVSAMVSIRT